MLQKTCQVSQHFELDMTLVILSQNKKLISDNFLLILQDFAIMHR